jgi:cytochrome c-type biogenesis protein CcmF
MTPELGRAAVLIALAACSIGAVTGIWAGITARVDAARWTRWMAGLFAFAMVAAVGLMEFALITHDYSVKYVAEVGSNETPLAFTIVSLWSSLDGSILLWALILAIWAGVFAWRLRDNHPEHAPFALGTILAVGVFFTFLVSGIANPFDRIPEPLSNGPGPNPLLQNHILMIIHPPTLYLGYVGMTVPFSMGCAALMNGSMPTGWARTMRRWMLVPWTCLTVGIILGGWWSYEVLGWGGYWAWDPVENASFMPWLTATAFIHSSMMMERKEHLKGWTISLVMASFLLTLLGTFMTRSGVFNSVHSFTQSPIGPVFLGFLALCLVFCVLLLAARVDTLSPPISKLEGPWSRDFAFLGNNLLFAAFTFTVLLGTVYPLLNEVMTDVQISVGEPYFNRMSVPICMGILFLMGVGPALPWGRAEPGEVMRQLSMPTIVSVVIAAGCVAMGLREPIAILTFALSGFAGMVTLKELTEPGRQRAAKLGEPLPKALLNTWRTGHRRAGGYVVHLGVVFIAVAIAASSVYRSETEMTIREGKAKSFLGYDITYTGTERVDEPHRWSRVAHFQVSKDGEHIGDASPRLNHYKKMGQAIGTPTVISRLDEDLYLSLVQVDTEGKMASLSVVVEPLVWWLWFGGGVMLLGSVISGWPAARRKEEEDAA